MSTTLNTAVKKRPAINIALKFLQNNAPLVTLIFLFSFAAFRYEYFFTPLNLINILRQVSMLGLVAIGMTFVILIGGIDLSVGSILAVAGVLAANLSGVSLTLCLTIPLLAGIFLGFINGLVITKLRIIPFIATLAMMIGARGIAHISTGEISIRIKQLSSGFLVLGRSYIFGIPLPTIIFVATVILASVIAKYTKFGRALYAVGGNEEAAAMMGLNINRVKILAYTISGGLAAFAGIILTSRLGAGQPVAGQGWELDAIAATVIGGTLLTGGKGKFSGTLLGVLIIGIITNILNMDKNLNTWWEHVVKGMILLVAIILQYQTEKRKIN
jgi:ribose transport system permease protein